MPTHPWIHVVVGRNDDMPLMTEKEYNENRVVQEIDKFKLSRLQQSLNDMKRQIDETQKDIDFIQSDIDYRSTRIQAYENAQKK
jgi:peptidoglycan hydrolase CwlO-like protein